ncbi:hypothetical protein OESDEN_09707 [Oesophagostomum dentatum]|uniref:Uncharacterized protein n=1 Tax=Oesophagostomum dentatum TaxID=61180 RepID=A0A0B1T2R0_OESDE|nr:hypothetical protein OESDEN_09707 [Oesophagostomum dentatum]
MLAEMFYYKTVETSMPNVVRIIVQVATAIGFSIVQRWLCAPPQIEPPRRKGRLFAKHYMEGNLLTPPDTDDVRELKKQL